MIATGGVFATATDLTLLARIQGASGVPITRASISSIAYTVTNLTNGAAVGSGTFTVASTVFDSLQIDSRWTFDSAANPDRFGLFGYNFLGVIPGTLFPPAVPGPAVKASKYQADVTFTPTTGGLFRQIFTWTGQPVFG